MSDELTHIALAASEFDDAIEDGYTMNESEDGSIAVANRNNRPANGFNLAVRPSYVTAEMSPNWPELTMSQSKFISHIAASTNGGSDGFVWYGRYE